MKTLNISLAAAAACMGLATGARSTDIFKPPMVGFVDGCGTVVFDEICGTLFQMDSGQHFGFAGLEDFQIGDQFFVSGDVCLTCLLVQCGSPWSAILSAEISPCVDGDLNFDRVVNSLDLGVLLSNWSIPTTHPGCGGATPCYSDIDGDGHVNSIDLGVLLSNWTM